MKKIDFNMLFQQKVSNVLWFSKIEGWMKPENELFFSRNMLKVKYIYCKKEVTMDTKAHKQLSKLSFLSDLNQPLKK